MVWEFRKFQIKISLYIFHKILPSKVIFPIKYIEIFNSLDFSLKLTSPTKSSPRNWLTRMLIFVSYASILILILGFFAWKMDFNCLKRSCQEHTRKLLNSHTGFGRGHIRKQFSSIIWFFFKLKHFFIKLRILALKAVLPEANHEAGQRANWFWSQALPSYQKTIGLGALKHLIFR